MGKTQDDLEVGYVLCLGTELFTKSNFLQYQPEPGSCFYALKMPFTCKNKQMANLEGTDCEPVTGQILPDCLKKHGTDKCRDLLIEHGFSTIDEESDLYKQY